MSSAQNNLQVGRKLVVRGRACAVLNQIHTDTGERLIQFMADDDHSVFRLSQADFNAAYNEGAVVWSDHLAHAADKLAEFDEPVGAPSSPRYFSRNVRRWFCEQFDACPVSKSDASLMAWASSIAPQCPDQPLACPSPGAIRDWLRSRGMPGKRRPKYMGDRLVPCASPRLAPEIEQSLSTAAEPFWSDRRVTVKDVFATVAVDVHEMNRVRTSRGLPELKRPGLSTIRRRLTRHADYDRTRSRQGAKVAKMFKPLRAGVEPTRILETVIIDSTIVDCHVIDDVNFVPVGRPWLTVAIDVYSRCILAAHLSFTPPSLETAMATLRQVCTEKSSLAAKYPNIPHVWPAFGVPETVLVDNSWEQSGGSFRDACADVGIAVKWAPVKTPEYKGVGERFFKTLNTGCIHKLAGSVPMPPEQLRKHGIDPQADAVLLLSELDELIYHYVVEIYGRNYHSGIRAVPEDAWRRNEKLYGISYASDLRSLNLSLSKLAGTFTLDRAGIQFLDLTYRSDDVFDLLNDLLPLAPKRGKRAGTVDVKVKYWPEDISKISVWNDVRKTYVTLDCTQQLYTRNLSEHLHKKATQFAIDAGLKFSTEVERCEALVAFNAKIRSFVTHRLIGNRRQSQRLLQTEAASVASATARATQDFNERNIVPIETVANRVDARAMKGPVRASAGRGPKKVSRPVITDRPAAETAQDSSLAGTDWIALIDEVESAGADQ